MKLFLYTIDLIYQPGKYMFIADLLNRNYKNGKNKVDLALKNIVHIVKISEINFSQEKFKISVKNSVALSTVTEYCFYE